MILFVLSIFVFGVPLMITNLNSTIDEEHGFVGTAVEQAMDQFLMAIGEYAVDSY